MHQRGFPTNQKSGRPHVTLSFTEAPLMRLSVGSLRQVVKRDLRIGFRPQQLTSYGGLELLHRYVRRLGLYRRLRRACADLGGDYGGARLSLLLLALFYVGARRVEHLKYLVGDPLVHRFSGLGRMPSILTIGRISATTPWWPTSRRPATSCDSRTARATCTTPSSRPRSCGS